jgi:cobalt-zinc-cadmium efflux system outer membrane protein
MRAVVAVALSGIVAVLGSGCTSTRDALAASHRPSPRNNQPGAAFGNTAAPGEAVAQAGAANGSSELIVPALHSKAVTGTGPSSSILSVSPDPPSLTGKLPNLAELEAAALTSNPAVLRLEQQVLAAWAKTEHIDRLPDPTVGANLFVSPIETAAGSQRANLNVAQMIPWLERLDAKTQQACCEAMALQQALDAQRLNVVADVRAAWFRLFVLGRQMMIARAHQQLLGSLIELATARIATGTASQGDVLLGTLEISRLEEQLISWQQQIESTKAELNRLAGREASVPVGVPETLEVALPDWSHEFLSQLAFQNQPAIEAARLQTHATRWGIEVARLERRPNFAVNASWFAIDGNRPASPIVDVGQDAWSLGAQVSLPVWRKKYDALENEAIWKHQASHATIEEVTRHFDSRLRDLWEQAVAADRTRQLYADTILPQARQTLDADQQSYASGAVEFDRVVRDVRNVLTLEDGLHRATGQLATALARIEEAIGGDVANRVGESPASEN